MRGSSRSKGGAAQDGHETGAAMDEIEERLAHLIRQTDDLSDVVTAQARRIEALERQVALLLERERGRDADAGNIYLGDERPPHW